MNPLELIPWAFSILLLASMLRLALVAFRSGEFAGRPTISPPPPPPPAPEEAEEEPATG
jgi:hypothetical protein